MSSKGRFDAIEGGGLPPVSNYDYPEDNLYIRGVEDRSFRFQEVCSESSYLFQQQSINGDFSLSGALVLFTGDGEYDLLDRALTGLGPSGAYLYSGWLATGLNVYDLPFSGAGHGGIYKSLPGYTGEFWGAPKEGTHSPVLIATGNSGVYLLQTGLTLSGSTKHQAFGSFQLLHSQTGIRMDYYIEGFTGADPWALGNDATNTGNVVAYFSPLSSSWQYDMPLSGLTVAEGTTDVAFDFTTSNYPRFEGTGVERVPSGFNIRVGLNTFREGDALRTTSDDDAVVVQVESLYVDEYMKKDAFTDVIVPSGYMIQITPDLGWHDTLAMFGERETAPNPHLVTLGPYTLSSGLVDNLDGSVTVGASVGEMERATSNNYRKYLWRSLAVSTNPAVGQGCIVGGFPRRFTYLGRVFDEEFSVDQVWDDPLSITKLIVGKKSRRMKVLVDGLTDHAGLEYVSDVNWKLTIVMDSPTKDISIRGQDKGGARTSEKFLTLTSESIGLTEKALWNVFDEYGLMLGVERLKTEDNETYADRIKDAFLFPGTHFFDGVVHGGTRELGLSKQAGAVVLTHRDRGDASYQSIHAEVQASAFLVRTPDLVATETVLVDPVNLTCDLAEYIADDPSLVEMVDGNRVNLDQVSVFDESSEQPNLRKLQFKNDALGGKLIRVTYPFYREYTFTTYKTLGTLIPALKTFTNVLGTEVLNVTTDKDVAGHESTYGLHLADVDLFIGETVQFAWSPVQLKRVGDRVYRESFRNDDGTLWNTKFYKWVQELKSTTNTEWGHVIADKAVWDAADNTLDGYDHVPTLTDPSIVGYSTTGGREMDAEEVQARNFRDVDGKLIRSSLLVSNDFIPGVAHTHDLLPSIYSTMSSSPEIAESVDVLVGETGNSRIIFFSGNIN